MVKTAIYNGRTVYINYISEDRKYVLASNYDGGSKSFKISVSELTDLNFKIDDVIL